MKCSLCGDMFDVETEAGALFLTHPSEITYYAWIRKCHICRDCEEVIIRFIDDAMKGNYEAWIKIKLNKETKK